MEEIKTIGGHQLPRGADGGHYTPVVTQTAADTMTVEFQPSKAGMAAVEPVEIKLPVGSGSGQNAPGTSRGQWVILGDSISVSKGYTNKFYYDFIKDDLGLTARVLAVGGQGYFTGEGSRFFETQCPNIPDDYAVLTIMGGTNDSVLRTVDGSPVNKAGEVTDTTADTFYGALYLTLIEGIQKKHPEKPFGVIIPIPRNNSDYYRTRCDEVCEALVTFCEHYNIPYLDLHKQGGVNPYVDSIAAVQYASDKIHLNDLGHEIIARRIKNFVDMLSSVTSGGSSGGSGGSGGNTANYTVTNNLIRVTNNNGASSVAENAAYTATLTADSGYILDNVTVTMGGVDVTSTAYNNGVVSIPAVTGAVVITASAVASETPNDPAENIFDSSTMVLSGSIAPAGTASSVAGSRYVKIPVTGGTKYNVYYGGNFANWVGVAQWDESNKVVVWLANGSTGGNEFRLPDQTVIAAPGVVRNSDNTAFTFTAEPTAKYLVFNTNDTLTAVLSVTKIAG